jgi:hypothetical protein
MTTLMFRVIEVAIALRSAACPSALRTLYTRVAWRSLSPRLPQSEGLLGGCSKPYSACTKLLLLLHLRLP